MQQRAPRIGLVLASGGCVGVSWELGALEGVRRATGFEPHHADVIVGTSAGAFVGGVALTLGAPLAYAHTSGDDAGGLVFDAADRERAARVDRHIYGGLFERFPFAPLSFPRLGSVAGMRRMARGEARGLAVAAASLLPEGLFSIRKVGQALREVCPSGWPTDRLRVTTFDLETASPRVLSATDCEGIDFADAVSASCAIPGVFAPLRLGGRRLADGGIWSATYLDELAGRDLDLVLVLHPLVGLRARCLAQLDEEQRRLERAGTRVLVVTPDAEERAGFPRNFLDVSGRAPIMRRAALAAERALSCDPLAAALMDAARPRMASVAA
jgi:NTE family protein